MTTLEPRTTGPYSFNEATGMTTITLGGCNGGTFEVVLSNPRPMLEALGKLLDGKQTLAEREGWAK